jgi:glycerophosphoryl diester phosphodiesterase
MVLVFQETPTYIVHRAQIMNSRSIDYGKISELSAITDWVEIDVRRSVDGRLIVFHNEKLSTGERAGSLTYDHLERLGVHSLEQLVRSLPAELNVVFDVKNSIDDATCPSSETTGFLAAQAARTFAEDRTVLVTSFDPSIVARARKDEPSVLTGLTSWQGVPLRESIPAGAGLDVDVLAVHVDSLHVNGIKLGDSRAALASQVNVAHRSGLQLACWGGGTMTEADVTYLVDLGIDAVYLDEGNLRALRRQADPAKGAL